MTNESLAVLQRAAQQAASEARQAMARFRQAHRVLNGLTMQHAGFWAAAEAFDSAIDKCDAAEQIAAPLMERAEEALFAEARRRDIPVNVLIQELML